MRSAGEDPKKESSNGKSRQVSHPSHLWQHLKRQLDRSNNAAFVRMPPSLYGLFPFPNIFWVQSEKKKKKPTVWTSECRGCGSETGWIWWKERQTGADTKPGIMGELITISRWPSHFLYLRAKRKTEVIHERATSGRPRFLYKYSGDLRWGEKPAYISMFRKIVCAINSRLLSSNVITLQRLNRGKCQ